MLTPKENYLKMLRHEETEYVPCMFTDGCVSWVAGELETGASGGGMDGFGVRWVTPYSGGGAPIPTPGEFLLDDVTDWKKKVTIPNVDEIDWDKIAEKTLPVFSDETKVKVATNQVGVFERLGALMGFENALISMVTEPEAVNDLFEAITDYKVKHVEKCAKYLKPDMYLYLDDVAQERSTFMSIDTYRELIKPHHKRLCSAIINCGMIPSQHTCGRAEDLIEDFIEIGAACWNSVQPSNDIVSLLEKYGDKISIEGGYDTNGPPSYSTVTLEEVEAEIRRCYAEYGKFRGYSFWGALIQNAPPEKQMEVMMPLVQTVIKIRMENSK